MPKINPEELSDKQLADRYRQIAPLLGELIEARGKATQNEFYCDQGGELMNDTGCVAEYPKDSMFKDVNFVMNMEFFALSANTIPKIQKIVEGDDA